MIDKKIIKFIKFFIFWFLTYFINIGFTFLLKEKFFLSKEFSYFISLLIVTLINFSTSLKLIFKEKYSNLILKKYLFFLILITLINFLLTKILSDLLSENYLYIIIFIVTTFFFFIKFFIYEKYVFKNQNNKKNKI